MLNLNDLRYFVAAVDSGGFAAAGRLLGVPKSTVSKRVAELERALGARLVHRTSRSFALTGPGRDFHERAAAALVEAEAAETAVRARQAEPSGPGRITSSVPVAQQLLAPHLPRLAAAHPRLRLQLDVSDRFVDIVQEGYDIAVRSHAAPLPDSGLVQRQVMAEPVILVAAPAYLACRPAPAAPDALADHDGLLTGAGNTAWRLEGPGGAAVLVEPRARMVANESTVLLAAAHAGLGIACLPELLCDPALRAGTLLRVLPGWRAGTVVTTLLLPHRRGQLPGVRATVEFLAACLAAEAPAR
ncbi:LysR substrate-binding domain-containing protein [Luteimonas sp. RD2P54]|uniref:LysR substrate-binding domain-containing protein n=1 Tax=Luteimonas endophytica TaxID=3042023 RepID=A0ABT6JA62_9GAMM|nr:LysR substrate-binding domain-containing protein [Luteimonas endophytica]MDH5823711.1 LysR substrate-binding domain-containing protein [Luteimonas endophytica]